MKPRKPIWQYCAEKRQREGKPKAAPKPRKPMKRSASAFLRARNPMRKVSAKRRAELPERRAACSIVAIRSAGCCEAGLEVCSGYGQDFHEILARSQGGSITDPENILHVCRPCHDWITAHMNEARKLGLAK